MRMTSKSVMAGALFSLATVAASGAANAAACPGTAGAPVFYSAYLATPGFSCTIGDKTFSNFSFSSSAVGTGVAIPATGATVPVFALNLPNDIGLEFTSIPATVTGSATSGGTVDATFDFTVAVTSGAALINDDTETIVGSTLGTGTGTVAGLLTTTATPPVTVATLNVGVPSPPGVLVDTMDFAPEAALDVTKDLEVTVVAGVGNTASISVLSDFSRRPPPYPNRRHWSSSGSACSAWALFAAGSGGSRLVIWWAGLLPALRLLRQDAGLEMSIGSIPERQSEACFAIQGFAAVAWGSRVR